MQVTSLYKKQHVWDYTQRDVAKSQVCLFGKADHTGVGLENDMDEVMDIRVRQEYFSDKSRKKDLADECLAKKGDVECGECRVQKYKIKTILQGKRNCSNAMMITVIQIKSGMLQVQKC